MTKKDTVLVVDDQMDIRLLVGEFLRMEGHPVIEAANGQQAVDLALREKPALIIMDIMMPVRDGLSAVQEIRAHDPLVSVIMLTAFSTEQHAVRALQAGADDYMHKPFDPTELHAKVTTGLERYRLRKENKRLQDRLTTILEHYLPASVAQRLIDAPEMPHLGGERQVVSVLFADLRGFTSFTTMTAPEDLVAYLNRYLSIAADAVLKYNGTVDKFIGDGIMAVFNAPLADERHVLNAVCAAQEIHKQIETVCASEEQFKRFKLEFGVGVHTGEAIVGNIGAAHLMSYTAVGDVVNMAKRLEELALPGQTLVTQEVVAGSGGRLKTQPLAPVTIKGRSGPQTFFKVLEITDPQDQGARTEALCGTN